MYGELKWIIPVVGSATGNCVKTDVVILRIGVRKVQCQQTLKRLRRSVYNERSKIMGLLSWIVFGALAGAVAGMVTGAKSRGCLTNIVIGVIGAFIGGFLINFVTGREVFFGWDLRSFAVAVVGAIILLVLTGAGRRK
jgi:uncharacterized membrane protein YeaQ/YmgE (transglycosylase-associated protein family)